MSLKKVHDDQPKEFKFSPENLRKADEILKRYPEKIAPKPKNKRGINITNGDS